MTTASQSGTTKALAGPNSEPALSQQGPPAFSLILLALASGSMLWASYYPLNIGWLGWIALTPLLSMVRAKGRPWKVYAAALLCGLVFFVPALQWMRVADDRMYVTWLALALYCALYFPVALGFLRYLHCKTRLPLIVTVPVVWTALEFLRAHLISGFPWYYLAHTQHEVLPLIQISDLTGAYGLSALMAAVNAVAFELLRRWERFRQLSEAGLRFDGARMPMRFQFLGVVSVTSAFLVYGVVRIENANFEKGPDLLLIQPNVPQQIRNEAWANANGNDAARDVMTQYVDLTVKALNHVQKPALIVWPESSLPRSWFDITKRFREIWPNAAKKADETHAQGVLLARDWRTDFLVGATRLLIDDLEDESKNVRYNSAILIRGDGQVAGAYDKIHRVPFGEYLPFRETFSWMQRFSPYDFDYSVRAGTTLNRFQLGRFTFGVLICYEDTDPTLARQYALASSDGPAVDFFVNISNDGWFDGTSQHEQHLATCRFRAVEARRAIARSVNMGISGVIDGNGSIVSLPGAGISGSKKREGYVDCTMPIDHRISYYAILGDWLPWGCWLGLACACLLGRFRPVTSSNPS